MQQIGMLSQLLVVMPARLSKQSERMTHQPSIADYDVLVCPRYSEAITLLLPPTAAATPLLTATGPTELQPQQQKQQQLVTTFPVSSAAAVAAAAQKPVAAADVPELRVLLSNRSLAHLKAGKAAAAAEDAAAVVELSPGWHKGHWRLGKALCDLSRWEGGACVK